MAIALAPVTLTTVAAFPIVLAAILLTTVILPAVLLTTLVLATPISVCHVDPFHQFGFIRPKDHREER